MSVRNILCTVGFISLCQFAQSQKIEYKDGFITNDGAPVAKMSIEKKNFGLTKNFEVSSLAGKKLLIAVPATEFEKDKSDNTTLYYRVTFLTSNQVGIFKVNALGQEKSFVKLIGTSGIFVGDSTGNEQVREFIALKSASPTRAVDYTVVSRNRIYPVKIKDDKTFEQEDKIIGRYTPKGTVDEASSYEFYLPSGVIIAKASFTGGNNAQNMELFTAKDNFQRLVPIPQEGKVMAGVMNGEKNWMTLQRVARWLVDKGYM